MMDAREIPRAPALSHQTPTRLQRIVKTSEETWVVEYPVKRCGAEHRIGLLEDCQ